MTLYSSLRQMSRNTDATSILEAAELDSNLDACLKNFQDTAESRQWLAEQHPDMVPHIEGLTPPC